MPKGGATSLIPVFAGIRQDLDAFLKTFLMLKTRRFTEYKKMFMHHGMMHLFDGRTNSAEILEFNQNLLTYCLPYIEEFICPGTRRSLEERLFGLYSLYTFFYLQTVDHVMKIRIDPDTARSFVTFSTVLVKEHVLDAQMCLKQLKDDCAFKIVAFIDIHDPSFHKRFHADDKLKELKTIANVNDPLANLKALVDSPIFHKLNLVHQKYTEMKDKLKIHCHGTSSLVNVQKAAKAILDNNLKEKEGEVVDSNKVRSLSSNHSLTRAEIKEKAYRAEMNVQRSRRHRTVTRVEMPPEFFEFMEVAEKPDDMDDSEEKEVVEVKPPEIDEPIQLDIKEEKKLLKSNRKRPKKEKRGPGRPKKIHVEQKNANEKKPAAKKMKIEEDVKPKGRRTNNSVAAELFSTFFEPQEKPKIERKKETKQVEIAIETKKSQNEQVEEVDETIGKTSNTKRVSFRENKYGEVDTIVHEIPYFEDFFLEETEKADDFDEKELSEQGDVRPEPEDARHETILEVSKIDDVEIRNPNDIIKDVVPFVFDDNDLFNTKEVLGLPEEDNEDCASEISSLGSVLSDIEED